jgi:hypothetical protein
MSTARIRLVVFAAAVSTSLWAPNHALAQDSLSAARDLYTSAAYEDALAVLNRLAPTTQPSDRLALNQYRAFCLVALRRNAEAEQAIEEVLSVEPSYVPSTADASPRLLSAFASGRQRVLPALLQARYAQAKGKFDRQEFAAAAAEFDLISTLLNTAEMAEAASRPPLSDIRTLAAGFRDLSARAATPVAPAVQVPAPPPQQPPTTAAAPRTPRIYNSGEARVSPPIALRQDMPQLPAGVVSCAQGVLEVIINEFGVVETATIRVPIDPRYDRLVVAATKLWRFQPATIGDTPVKFRKIIGVKTKPD